MEEGESFFKRYKLQIILLVLVIVAAAIASYFSFVKPMQCDSYACFQSQMSTCSRATYINEEPEASWRYTINGKSNGACNIEVVLLQAKKGDLELDNLRGYSMECSYPEGVVAYPDSDLKVCTGKLKEELQDIIIKKLYAYILDNLGALNESIERII